MESHEDFWEAEILQFFSEDIPLERYEENGDDSECAVWMEKLVQDEDVRKLKCGHIFHSICI